MRISDWSSDVCSSDLAIVKRPHRKHGATIGAIALPGVAQMLAHGVRREFEMASDPPDRIALGGPDETLPLPVGQARTDIHAVGIGDADRTFEGSADDTAGHLPRLTFGRTPRPPHKEH